MKDAGTNPTELEQCSAFSFRRYQATDRRLLRYRAPETRNESRRQAGHRRQLDRLRDASSRSAVLAVGFIAGVLVLTTCGIGVASASGARTAGDPIPTATKDAKAASLVPARVKTAGVVNVATDATYAPMEFMGANGKTIVGMDADLATALGQVLGVPFKMENQSFTTMIGSIGVRYDLGISSITDTKAREKQVAFVDYFLAGASFMVQTGKNQSITSLSKLCGHSVGVQLGTIELAAVTAQAKKCSVKVVAYPTEIDANEALAAGRVDSVNADSPVNAYYAHQSAGAFQIVGPSYGIAPYGILVPHASSYKGFDKAIQAALVDLRKSGIYGKILAKWGLRSGALSKFPINDYSMS